MTELLRLKSYEGDRVTFDIHGPPESEECVLLRNGSVWLQVVFRVAGKTGQGWGLQSVCQKPGGIWGLVPQIWIWLPHIDLSQLNACV